MTKLFLLMAALTAQGPTAGGPLKIDGAKLAASDYVSVGTVIVKPASVSVEGGRIELSSVRQKALDAQLAKPSTVFLTLADRTSGNTTAMTLGQLKLMRTDNTWFVVNLSEGKWRQVDLGQLTAGSDLKLALTFDGKQLEVFKNGKSAGSTPYAAAGVQKLTLGSASDEKNPWKGEIKEFEILSKAVATDDIAKRANPTPSNGSNSTSTNTAPVTKSTVVEVELVNLSEVPEPSTILPYKEALVTQEYRVVSVKSGHLLNVDSGSTIRVARWGIISSKKTDVANQKKGDHLTLTLEKVSDHPSIEHQYTIDNLPENFTAPYLLDVSVKGG